MAITDLITLDEYRLMDYWRKYCCEDGKWDRFISTKTLLEKEWVYAKNDLCKLFGGKLRISKEIDYIRSPEEVEDQYEEAIDAAYNQQPIKHSPCLFIDEYRQWVTNYVSNLKENNGDEFVYKSRYTYISLGLNERLNKHCICTNRINRCGYEEADRIPLPDGKELVVTDSMKTMKYLSKIAEAFNLKGFEDFRVWQSLLTNERKIKGKLTLSIHPMDYMTMSDNDCGWNTCMSWGYSHEGEYRYGTIEMMNSPYVVVAYLESKEPMRFNSLDIKWTNKKWRQLYIVDDRVIINIKAYPYTNEYLTIEALNWLKDLAKENWGRTYENEEYYKYDPQDESLKFYTESMYNDFSGDNLVPRYYYVNHFKSDDETIEINYSGTLQCMVCGDYVNRLDDSLLWCNNCDNAHYCCSCEERIVGEDYYTLEGDVYCEDCYGEVAGVCDLCGDDAHVDNMYNIEISDGYDRRVSVFLCWNCYDRIKHEFNDGKDFDVADIDWFTKDELRYMGVRF